MRCKNGTPASLFLGLSRPFGTNANIQKCDQPDFTNLQELTPKFSGNLQSSCQFNSCYLKIKLYTNEPVHRTKTDPQVQKTNICLLKEKGREGGINQQESGISRYKLLHIKQINSKVLLYSNELYSVSYNNPCVSSVASGVSDCGPVDCSHRAPLPMEFSQQEY